MKYPKESLPVKPTKHIADKKFGFFQSEKTAFQEVAEELGLLQTRKGKDISYARHPLTFLVEAADDICYTIIDFEDGINLGLISEEYALEYMVKLVPNINTKKYYELTTKAARVGYLRALAIGTLIECKVITNAPTHYDTLVLKLFEDSDREEMSLYQELMNICNYVSVMTDSKSLRIFQKLKGLNVR